MATAVPLTPANVGDAQIEAAAAAIVRHGVAVLEDIVDPALLTRGREEVERDFPDLEAQYTGGYYVNADRRFTMQLPIARAFADPAVFANPAILALCARLLGEPVVLEQFGLLVSLPGAKQQQTHCDLRLFPEHGIERILPAWALAVAMPLVPLDEVNGTTAFFTGSHRTQQFEGEPDFIPRVKLGSALVWDYRVYHHGLANRSERDRPVLFSTFSRPWWIEPVPANATRYDKLCLPRGVYDSFDPDLQRLLVRATLHD